MVHLNYVEIGKRIKMRRKAMDLTQKELGKIVNLSEGSVSKYESGKVEDATTAKLNLFADVLRVDIAWLLGSNNNDNTESDLPKTIAAHFEGEDYTEEELQEILEYAKYIKLKRK